MRGFMAVENALVSPYSIVGSCVRRCVATFSSVWEFNVVVLLSELFEKLYDFYWD